MDKLGSVTTLSTPVLPDTQKLDPQAIFFPDELANRAALLQIARNFQCLQALTCGQRPVHPFDHSAQRA